MSGSVDAVVVGSGPNGLAAAITLARAGRSVLVAEAEDSVGGGMRSAQLTLPGFVHDVCSAVHPFALGSPFMRSVPLAGYGLVFEQPPVPLAHVLDDGPAVLLQRSVAQTAAGLERDGGAYTRLVAPLAARWDALAADILGPLPVPPRHPLLLARFGLNALRPARRLAEHVFGTVRARALFAGIAAHAAMPLEWPGTAAFGLVLAALAHAAGWPVARGGSGRIADALAEHLRVLGGEIVTGRRIRSLEQLPPRRAVLFDLTPRQILAIAAGRLPAGYRRALERYRYGPGVFKLDYALSDPIPWRDPACALAGTVHAGGTLEEIAAGERAVWRGEHPERPFVLVAQPSLFDVTRAPAGRHTAWMYCHVPPGSTFDMTARIEAQIERFAPGFRDTILARHTMTPAWIEEHNANYVGGDITGGVQDLRQLYTRPAARLNPYRMSADGLYICSASTPPGGGVHGMCGYHAARAVLRAA